MKIRKAKSSSEDKFDTFSITMELERPLLYNEEGDIDKKKQIQKIGQLRYLRNHCFGQSKKR